MARRIDSDDATGSLMPYIELRSTASIAAYDALRPGLTLVVGGPGSGKTALAHHLVDRFRNSNGRSHAHLLPAQHMMSIDDALVYLGRECVQLPLPQGEIVIVDGVDELADPPATRNLREFIARLGLAQGHLVATSRSLDFDLNWISPPSNVALHSNVLHISWTPAELWEAALAHGVPDPLHRQVVQN